MERALRGRSRSIRELPLKPEHVLALLADDVRSAP